MAAGETPGSKFAQGCHSAITRCANGADGWLMELTGCRHRSRRASKTPDESAVLAAKKVALKLLGCAIMRRSQRRWLFGTEATDTEFSEQRWSDLRSCAAAFTLTRNFLYGSSSALYLPVVKTVVTLVNRFSIKCV